MSINIKPSFTINAMLKKQEDDRALKLKYYDLLELFEYDINKTAYVILHYYGVDEEKGIDKAKIIKDLEKRVIEEYEKVIDTILTEKETALRISTVLMFKSNEEYIDYLRELLILNDVDFVEWVKPRESRIDTLTKSLFE